MGVRVSVIIPTWNRAAAVVEAVGDVLRQTETDLEVLVCDDGSTDDTRSRLAAIADPRLVWLDGPRSGCPAAPRNRGIGRARGEWIAFLDSDDRWLPTKLARQLEVARAAGVGAVSSNATRLRDGKPTGTVVDHPRPLIRTSDLLSLACSFPKSPVSGPDIAFQRTDRGLTGDNAQSSPKSMTFGTASAHQGDRRVVPNLPAHPLVRWGLWLTPGVRSPCP